MLTAIILTYNESKHIARCIKSLQSCCSRICILDSYSTDDTCKIAKSLGAEVFQNKWENNHAKQWNWGFQNCKIKTPWVIRMDADEYLLSELAEEIKMKLPGIHEDVSGIELTRRVIFKGKWLKRGGFYPIQLLRIFRPERGHCEQRLMDEHIVLDHGQVIKFDHDLVDENLNDMHWWTIKHINYARRESTDLLNQTYSFTDSATEGSTENTINIEQASRKRFLKEKVYAKLPMGIRPLLYFKFRFFIQLGILDGPKGWLFHFLQGFWYRLMVDVCMWEFEKATKDLNRKGKAAWILENWGIEV